MITKQQILTWLALSHQYFTDNEQYLTRLDTVIGDGDHGSNMHRGFVKVMEKLPSVADKDIGTIFKTVGMTLLSTVGGASGPLFGGFFMKAAQVLQGKDSLNFEQLNQALRAGVEVIVIRGRAELGDKTMCDVWLPLLDYLEQQQRDNIPLRKALQSAVEKSKVFVEETIPLQAKKGRASYLNERSIGHQDPGATSVLYFIEALAQAALSGEEND